MSDSRAFTKALIRACKRRVSDAGVDFHSVIAEVAAMRREDVDDDDVTHHFAEALLDLAQADAKTKQILRPAVLGGVRYSGHLSYVSQLAHTRVDDLRAAGLWDEEVAS